jgi:hypothetical protein
VQPRAPKRGCDCASSTSSSPMRQACVIVERVRSRRWFVSILFRVFLLGVAGLGCGASEGGNTRVRTRGSAKPAQLAVEIDLAQAVIDGASGSGKSLRRAAGSQQLTSRQLADDRLLRRPTVARLTRADYHD